MSKESKFDFMRVVDTLTSPSSSLRELAENSGFDVFSFYQKADLAGLDLSDQDLRGLNFNGANLRGTVGANILADEGAFNEAITDNDDFGEHTDEFDCFLSDVLHHQAKLLYLFAMFRPGAVDESIRAVRITSQKLAEDSGLSTATIRKARKAQVVALDSASSIARALTTRFKELTPNARAKASVVRQPMISLLELPNEVNPNEVRRQFQPVSRKDYGSLLALSAIIEEGRGKHRPANYQYLFKDSPSMLRWLAKYYVDKGETPNWIQYRSTTTERNLLLPFNER